MPWFVLRTWRSRPPRDDDIRGGRHRPPRSECPGRTGTFGPCRQLANAFHGLTSDGWRHRFIEDPAWLLLESWRGRSARVLDTMQRVNAFVLDPTLVEVR